MNSIFKILNMKLKVKHKDLGSVTRVKGDIHTHIRGSRLLTKLTQVVLYKILNNGKFYHKASFI